MNLRDRQRAATRDLLLRTAARLVAERGPEAATTRVIAAEAGVGVGTVFAHFPDKSALLEALLVAHVEAALDEATGTLPGTGAVDDLVHVAERLWAAYDRDPALARALLSETLFLADPGRPLSAQLRRFAAWVGEALAAGAARGEITPVEPALAFSAYFTTYFGLLVGGLRGEVAAGERARRLRWFLGRVLARRPGEEGPWT